MIKANELRIGNYVQHEPYPDEIWVVDLKLLKAIEFELVECVGIPLTKKRLVKCGFIYDKYKIFSHPILKCRWVTTNEILGAECDVTFLRFDSTCKYIENGSTCTDLYFIHELQNIYHCHAKKELEINL